MSEKMTRKELKAPDAFQKKGSEVGAWLLERRKAVVIAVVVALFGSGSVVLGGWISNRGQEQAAKELGAALAVLGRAVDASGTAPEPGAEAPFKTEMEKDEAVVKALSEFRSKHADSRAAKTASLPLAQAELRLGRADEALRSFEEYLATAPAGDPLRATALEGKGYALEAKGDLEKAVAAFEQLSRESTAEFLNGMGLYHRARLLIQQGKKEEAAKQLAEIPGVAPNSAAARLATDRMAVLAAEGVAVPPPSVPAADAG